MSLRSNKWAIVWWFGLRTQDLEMHHVGSIWVCIKMEDVQILPNAFFSLKKHFRSFFRWEKGRIHYIIGHMIPTRHIKHKQIQTLISKCNPHPKKLLLRTLIHIPKKQFRSWFKHMHWPKTKDSKWINLLSYCVSCNQLYNF